MATLSFNNTGQAGYAVLETQPENQPYPTNFLEKYFLGTTFGTLTNIEREAIVIRDYQMGIAIPEGQSSITFTPGTNIPGGIITLRGAGEVEVSLNGGAANNISFDNLTQLGPIS
jgi:hypothetical protein